MEQQEYDKLVLENGAVGLVRPTWEGGDYHKDLWNRRSVTFLICQNNTKHLTQPCIESVLRFYPNVNILVMDGGDDDASLYLQYMSKKYENIVVEKWEGRASHGIMLDYAMRNYITTAFAFLLDSDTIIMKGGFLEPMLFRYLENHKLYSIGMLMLVTRAGYGCGAPMDSNDVLRYCHPSSCLIHTQTYKQMNADFYDGGAPLAINMIAAEKAKLDVEAFNIDKFIIHNCGSSWQEVPTIWYNDFGVFMRPFVTFIITLQEHFTELRKQTDHDFNIVTLGNHVNKKVSTYDNVGRTISNYTYDIRFQVTGEYVCLLNESISTIDENFIHSVKLAIIENNVPKEIEVGGIRLAERTYWQQNDALV